MWQESQYFYYYNGKCKARKAWRLGLVVTGRTVMHRNLMKIRQAPLAFPPQFDKSWHFSTFMSPKAVVFKNVYAGHRECNRIPYNKVLYQRQAQLRCVHFCGSEKIDVTNWTDLHAYPAQICEYPHLAPDAWCARHHPRGVKSLLRSNDQSEVRPRPYVGLSSNPRGHANVGI